MKLKLFIPALAALSLALGSCSSDEPQPKPRDPNVPVLVEGNTYLALDLAVCGARSGDNFDPYAPTDTRETDICPLTLYTHVIIETEKNGTTVRRKVPDVLISLDGDNKRIYCNLTAMMEEGMLVAGQEFNLNLFVNYNIDPKHPENNKTPALNTYYNSVLTCDNVALAGGYIPMFGFVSGLKTPQVGEYQRHDEPIYLLRSMACIEVILAREEGDILFQGENPVKFVNAQQLNRHGYVTPTAEKIKEFGSSKAFYFENQDQQAAAQTNMESTWRRKTDDSPFFSESELPFTKFTTQGGFTGYRIYLPEAGSAYDNRTPLPIALSLYCNKLDDSGHVTGNLYLDRNGDPAKFQIFRNHKTRFIITDATPDRGLSYYVKSFVQLDPLNIPAF